MKPILTVGNLVKRFCKPKRIGKIYTGDPNRLYRFRPVARVGSKTYAGSIITGSTKILTNFRPIARHTALCKCGKSINPGRNNCLLV